MKLTNQQRDSIRRAVQADMPSLVDHTDAIRKRVREINFAALPFAIMRIAKDPDLSPYLETDYVYIGNNTYAIFVSRDRGYVRRDTAYTDDPTIRALVDEHNAAVAARQAADTQLRLDLELCTTDAVFRERFPDLAKYLPVTVKDIVKNLPSATTTMDALKAAGWPVETADGEA